MDQPLVTIIIPIYNAEAYLEAALNSILNQTFERIEIICVNDGSTDGSGDLLDLLASRDSRLRVMHIANKGIVNALNLALEHARGGFIARMDADDLSDSNRIALQVDFLKNHQEIGLVGSQILIVTREGLPIKVSNFPHHHEEIEKSLLKGMCPLAHPAIMARREVFQKVGGYHDCTAEDYDFFLRVGEDFKVANLPNVLLQYRCGYEGLKYAALEANSNSVIRSLKDALLRRHMDAGVIHTLEKKLNHHGKQMADANALARKHLADAWYAGNPITAKILGRKLQKKGGHNRKTLRRWLLAEAACLIGKKNRHDFRPVRE